ncbi:FecR family protein [Dysgonomonas sp. OttesenSCG-928-M03]|nr:FecR family protein [Dysgonomonas sp. OttesenSCG-928-M03]
MEPNSQKHILSEDFIVNTNLIRLIEEGKHDEIDKLKLLYPENTNLINDAITLVKYLKIEQPDVPQLQIDNDWEKLMLEIRKKQNKDKKKRIYLWVASTAACIAILLSAILYQTSNNSLITDQQETLLSILESAEVKNSGDIQIIAGNGQTTINNEETITQTESGDLLVGNEEKLNSSDIKTEYITIVVPKGKRTTIQFSDGTKAWINSGSKLVYPKKFAEKSRDITIDGEIYLDVVRNSDKPFYVHTKNFAVEVLGTQFNVSAYSDDTSNNVVLVEGSVKVSSENSVTQLQPSQGLFVTDDTFNVKNIDVYPYISWKEGIIKLEGQTLEEIMKRLSRYYGLEIHHDKEFGKEKYVGKLNMKDSIEVTLRSLSLSTSFKYTKKDNNIYIDQKKY